MSQVSLTTILPVDKSIGPAGVSRRAFGFRHDPAGGGSDDQGKGEVVQLDGFKTLAEGQTAEFELKAGEKGLHASNVVRA